MKVVIIEDEKLAAKKLERLLSAIGPDLAILTVLGSVEDAVNWIVENDQPDLFFMDIQLEDGICFEIFEAVEVSAPIIFTTAFDSYAIRAFKQNSIDYLLKPIDQDELKAAIEKFKNYYRPIKPELLLDSFKPEFKERFLVKIGSKYKSIQTSSIALFYVEERCNFIRTNEGKTYAMDHSLEAIEKMVDRNKFFRINRTTIVNYSGIVDVVVYSNSRLKLNYRDWKNQELLVSRDRISEFKKWMDR